MNPQNGYPWLMGFADWVVKTMVAISVTAFFGALGCALWMLFQVISAGFEALKI